MPRFVQALSKTFCRAVLWGLLLATPALADCVSQHFEQDYFYLKNTCGQPINIKYTFSESRQIAGQYTTLRPNERTFDKAKNTEGHKYYYCKFPEIPQNLHGDCIRQ